MIKSFKKLLSDSSDLQFVQDNVDYVFQSLSVEPMVSGILIKDVALTTTAQNIQHGLSRAWQGFFVTKSTASVNAFWDSITDDGVRKPSTIALKASSDASVDLYIF